MDTTHDQATVSTARSVYSNLTPLAHCLTIRAAFCQLLFMCPKELRVDRHARTRALVMENIKFVARTLRRAGVPRSELDDQIQQTFIIMAGRLDDVRPGAERSFLFQVAQNVASHARRSLARRRDFPSDRIPDQVESCTPEFIAGRKQTHQQLDRILGSLREPLRVVFVLYEIENRELAEIAALLRIPRGTVASRLRRARIRLREHPDAIELAWENGVQGVTPIEGPPPLRRGELTTLERALLAAGMRARGSDAIVATTLALLGCGPSAGYAVASSRRKPSVDPQHRRRLANLVSLRVE